VKILDVSHLVNGVGGGTKGFWNVNNLVLGNAVPGVYRHEIAFPYCTVEWRAAEYDMSLDDVDSILHLILHEPILSKEADKINCYTPGFTKAEALAWRLSSIDTQIKIHEARMTKEHKAMHRWPAHKHPTLDPIRERGIHPQFYAGAVHMVGANRARVLGNERLAQSLFREAEQTWNGMIHSPLTFSR
jgi:hypothetical protein